MNFKLFQQYKNTPLTKDDTFILSIICFFSSTLLLFNSFYLLWVLLFTFVTFLTFKNRTYLPLLLLCTFSIFTVTLKNFNIKTTVITKIESAKIEAHVERTYFKNGGLRAVVSNIKCLQCRYKLKKNPPKKLIASFKEEGAVIAGEKVIIYGPLLPLPKKVHPYFYDVEMKNKYMKIGGYIRVKKFTTLKTFFNLTSILRSHTINVLEKVENRNAKAVATALFLGDKGRLSKEEYNVFKKAGIAHVLAVSGLHMSIFCFLIFKAIFHLLAFTPLCNMYDTKKIAGLFGLASGFLYLTVSGFSISGFRSFLMVLFLFLNFIFYRGSSGIRSLFIAAFIILSLMPEEAMFPSLALSFISVLCLLKCHNFTSQFKGKSFLLNTFSMVFVVIYSSFIIFMCTIPFAIFYFNFIHFYGIVSNIIAIPLLSIFIMPIGLLALLTQFEAFIILLQKSIEVLIVTANFFSNLPFSSIFLPSFNGRVLFIFTLGLVLFLCIKKFKFIGSVLILSSVILYFLTAKLPDIIVNSEYLVIKDEKRYISIFNIKNKFLKEVWQEKVNSTFVPYKLANPKTFKCEEGVCFSVNNKNGFAIIYDDNFNMQSCEGKILILLIKQSLFEDWRKKTSCNFKKVITFTDVIKITPEPFLIHL